MNLTIKSDDNVVTCYLSKRLDTNVSFGLEPEIDQATEQNKNLVFDFSEVDYISSTFLRICLKKRKELGNEHFWIINPKPDIKRVFKIAGLVLLIRE